jgi:hypothetical protein
LPEPEPGWQKMLDWATGGDGTADEQHTAAEVGAEALYGDPNGLTQLVDELRRIKPKAKAEGAAESTSSAAPEAKRSNA